MTNIPNNDNTHQDLQPLQFCLFNCPCALTTWTLLLLVLLLALALISLATQHHLHHAKQPPATNSGGARYKELRDRPSPRKMRRKE